MIVYVFDKLESDLDGDGTPDLLDDDKNGNGLSDDEETDTDQDGIIDREDEDDDNDGIPDDEDADDDNDGLPDTFHIDADKNNVSDLFEMDSDQDGHSDGDEFLSGTDPKNSLDILAINKLSIDTQGNLILHWSSKPGKTYQIQGSGLLDKGVWKNIGTQVIADSKHSTFNLGRPKTVLHRVVLIR